MASEDESIWARHASELGVRMGYVTEWGQAVLSSIASPLYRDCLRYLLKALQLFQREGLRMLAMQPGPYSDRMGGSSEASYIQVREITAALEGWESSRPEAETLANCSRLLALAELVVRGVQNIASDTQMNDLDPSADEWRRVAEKLASEGGPLAAKIDAQRIADLDTFSQELQDARKDAQDVRQVAEVVRQTAGVVGEGVLSEAYREYARDQAIAANRWLILTVGLFAVLGFLGFELLIRLESAQWTAVLARVLLIAPLSGLAVYFGRVSARRRTEAARADLISVQLRTFDAYRLQLSDAASDDLTKHFGYYLYGQVATGKDDAVTTMPPEILDLLKAVLTRAHT